MSLLPKILVPTGPLFAFYKSEAPPTNGAPIDKERLGLTRKSKEFTEDEWREVYQILDELMDEGSTLEHFLPFSRIAFWQDHFSIAKILRMIASLNKGFSVTARQRRAMNVIFQTIMHEGVVTRDYAGNTLLHREFLVKHLTDQEYKNGAWVKKGKDFRYSMEIDKDSSPEMLNFDEIEINEILDFALAEGVLGQCDHAGDPHIYSVQQYNMEAALLTSLRLPAEETTQGTAPEELTAKQKEMFYKVLTPATTGIVNLGEPGTGKSFTASAYIAATGPKNWLVLATTGTAAQVLAHSVPEGVACYTISWAAFNMDKIGEKKYVLVDECSMLNTVFISQLSRLIAKFQFKKIVLLGDPNQLPPVGVGAFFASFDDAHNYGVDTVIFTEQKRMSQDAMLNLRGLTDQTPPTRSNLFDWAYVDVPFRTQDAEKQYLFTGKTVLEILELLRQKGSKQQFDADMMRDKATRLVVSTFKNRWANFYTSMMESMRRGLDAHGGIMEELEAIDKHYDEHPLEADPLGIEKAWKRSRSFVQWNIIDTLWASKKPSAAFCRKYRAVAESIAKIEAVRDQLKAELTKNFANDGGWYRSNRNIWVSKISPLKLAKLKKKYKIAEITGDVANGTKFLCEVGEEGTIFRACDTKATIVFKEDANIQSVLSLAWVQTTHKLQGDQGQQSLYIHDKDAPMSLIYVALSRGRTMNALVEQCATWRRTALAKRNYTRLSTLCIQDLV